MTGSDPLVIAGRTFGSRLFLGTAGYPNRKVGTGFRTKIMLKERNLELLTCLIR
jgi:thiazole synthase ThiGH ThiG subunit